MYGMMRNLGALELDKPDKVSSGRVLMLAAFVFCVLLWTFIGVMIAFGRPAALQITDAQGVVVTVTSTWDQWSGFVKEVGDTVKWFLGPYLVGVAGSAYKTKKENE